MVTRTLDVSMDRFLGSAGPEGFQLRTGHRDGIFRLQPFGYRLHPLRIECIVQDAAHGLGHRGIIAGVSPHHRGNSQSVGARGDTRLIPTPWHQHHRHAMVEGFHHDPMPGVADD
jgi:hypothetical protein